jgi:hypothetical protein
MGYNSLTLIQMSGYGRRSRQRVLSKPYHQYEMSAATKHCLKLYEDKIIKSEWLDIYLHLLYRIVPPSWCAAFEDDDSIKPKIREQVKKYEK